MWVLLPVPIQPPGPSRDSPREKIYQKPKRRRGFALSMASDPRLGKGRLAYETASKLAPRRACGARKAQIIPNGILSDNISQRLLLREVPMPAFAHHCAVAAALAIATVTSPLRAAAQQSQSGTPMMDQNMSGRDEMPGMMRHHTTSMNGSQTCRRGNPAGPGRVRRHSGDCPDSRGGSQDRLVQGEPRSAAPASH